MSDTPLSIDAAVAALNDTAPANEAEVLNNNEQTPAGAEHATEADAPDLSQDDPDLDLDVETGAEEPTEGDDQEDDGSEEAEEPIPAPEFWDSDFKARFANLGRDAQKLVAEQAKHGTAAIAKALNEAAVSRKSAEAEAQKLQESFKEVSSLVENGRKTFASKWAGVDEQQWLAAMAQDPQATIQARQVYEQERAALTALEQAEQKAQEQALTQFRQAQDKRLNEIKSQDKVAAKLLDKAKDPAAQQELISFLNDAGIPLEAMKKASASELVILLKAQEYDKAMKRATEKRSTVERPSSKPSGMRAPTAAPKSNQVSRLESQSRRLSQTGSVDDAIALLNMKDALRSK